MWETFYNKLIELDIGTNIKIYSHNLGSFDGYFILPSLYNITENPLNVDPIIDDRNKFINIRYDYYTQPYLNLSEEELIKEGLSEQDIFKTKKYTWTFLDSYRLFPVSLKDLCKIFGLRS